MLEYIKKEIENLTIEVKVFEKINDITNNIPGSKSRIDTIKEYYKKLVGDGVAKLLNPKYITDDISTSLGGGVGTLEEKKKSIAKEFGLEGNDEQVAFIQNIISLWESLESYISIDLFKQYITIIINYEIILKSNKYEAIEEAPININDLPVMEIFFKTKSTYKSNPSGNIAMMGNDELTNYGVFDLSYSVFSKEPQSDSWENAIKKEDILSWFISPKLKCAVQETKKSFTYIGNVNVEFDDEQIKVNPNKNKFYFYGNDNINEIESEEDYSIVVEELRNDAESFFQSGVEIIKDIEIEAVIFRLASAVELSEQTVESNQTLTVGLTYKVVINIDKNIVAYLSCIDLIQSLHYLKSSGVSKIDVGYAKNKLFIRSKDTNNIDNYSIIKEENIDEISKTIGVEYLEFLKSDISFKQKLNKLYSKRKSPLMLDANFSENYPYLANNYLEQLDVSNNESYTDLEKLNYVEEISEKYLQTYTSVEKGIRSVITKDKWANDYVLKVEETYWRYNTEITISELIAFLISKENNKYYRLLGLKILGFDYWLFFNQKRDELISKNLLFISKIKINLDNFYSDVTYQAESEFITGNVYSKLKDISTELYKQNISYLFTPDIAENSAEIAKEKIEEAKNSRENPQINPKQQSTPEETATLKLNIDLHCPLFYESSFNAAYGRTVVKGCEEGLCVNALGTGEVAELYGNALPLRTTQTDQSPEKFQAGHIMSFYKWLMAGNINYTTTGITTDEIVAAYILPIPLWKYAEIYTLRRFQDKDDNVVGITLEKKKGRSSQLSKDKLKSSLTAESIEMLHNKEDEYGTPFAEKIDSLTDVEAKKLFNLIMSDTKERVWDVKAEGRRLFNLWIDYALDAPSKKILENAWNEKYNNYAKPLLEKTPIFVSHNFLFGSREGNNPFDLMPAQRDGIRHIMSNDNSAVLLHEVGFGKTTTSIMAINQMFLTGEAKRALFIVPNAVYKKFEDEIKGDENEYGLFTDANIVLLGNAGKKTVMSLKKYSDDGKEEEAITTYLDFSKKINAIFGSLKEGKITLTTEHIDTFTDKFLNSRRKVKVSQSELDTLLNIITDSGTLKSNLNYHEDSSFELFLTIIKDYAKQNIKGYAEVPFIEESLVTNLTRINLEYEKKHIKIIKDQELKYLNLLNPNSSINKQLAQVKSAIILAKNVGDSIAEKNETQKEKNLLAKKDDYIKRIAKATITKTQTEVKSLAAAIKVYINYLGNILIDELGVYKPENLLNNTIIIAQHNAVNNLRASPEAIHRATAFKYGMDRPEDETLIHTANLDDWRKVFSHKSKYSKSIQILTTNPISLDKLLVDAVVVDEIHNYNNIAGKIDSRGIETSRTQYDLVGEDFRYSNVDGGKKTSPILAKQKSTKSSVGRADIIYHNNYKSAEANKMSMAAICFEMQYKNPKTKNVILLSATPFTDHPLQVYSVLGMANYSLLEGNGISSSYDFWNNYILELYLNGINHKEQFGLFNEVDKYFNDIALSNVITNIASVRIKDKVIEGRRPRKAVIPQEKASEEQLDSMGQFFEELELVTSRIDLSPAQMEMKNTLLDYINDDNNLRSIYDIFPVKEDIAIDQSTYIAQDVGLNELIEDALEDAAYIDSIGKYSKAEAVVSKLKVELSETYKQNNKLAAAIRKIERKYVYDDGQTIKIDRLLEKRKLATKKEKDKINEELQALRKEQQENLPEEDDDESSFQSMTLREIDKKRRIYAKALSVQSVQEALVISPYLVQVGYKGSKKYENIPDLSTDPAKVFVENSPKILFTVKAVIQTINYQKEELKKGKIKQLGGQVIYFNRMTIKYGGKEYNAHELLREYLSRFAGITNDEVGIISGNIKNKVEIKDKFNSGEIKVLIGSNKIKEGIDLHKNANSLYILQAQFNPTISMQLEGRIWRQGNPYSAVRITYVLALNSIDAFIYDKLNKKIKSIKAMLEKGSYVLGTTQFTMDAKERLLEIITDVDKLTKIEFSERKKQLSISVSNAERKISTLEKVKNIYPSLKAQIEDYKPTIEHLYQGIRKLKLWNYKYGIGKKGGHSIRQYLESISSSKKKELKAALRAEFNELTDEEKSIYQRAPESSHDRASKQLYHKLSGYKLGELYHKLIHDTKSGKYSGFEKEDVEWYINEVFDNTTINLTGLPGDDLNLSKAVLEMAKELDKKPAPKATSTDYLNAEINQKKIKDLDVKNEDIEKEFDREIKEAEAEGLDLFYGEDGIYSNLPEINFENISFKDLLDVVTTVKSKFATEFGLNALTYLADEDEQAEKIKAATTIQMVKSGIYLSSPFAIDNKFSVENNGTYVPNKNPQKIKNENKNTALLNVYLGSPQELKIELDRLFFGEEPHRWDSSFTYRDPFGVSRQGAFVDVTNDNPAILNSFQTEIAEKNKKLIDIPEIIQDIKDENSLDRKRNTDKSFFMQEIKEEWIKILSKRKKEISTSVDGAIKTFEKSNQIIKLR